MVKSKLPGQLALGFEPESSGTYIYVFALIEQIKRDLDTLNNPIHRVNEDPCGRAFYQDRIKAYREAVIKCRTAQ